MPAMTEENLLMGREISFRFFDAKKHLKDIGLYRTEVEFAEALHRNRGNLARFFDRKDATLHVSCLAYFCASYPVNANWLITGNGEMLDSKRKPIQLNEDRDLLHIEIKDRLYIFITELTGKGTYEDMKEIIENAGITSSQHVYAAFKSARGRSVPYPLYNLLVNSHHLNANWVLLGVGSMFTK